MQKITCFTFGIAQSEPGLAAIGVSISDATGVVLYETGRTIGNGTSEYAAYQAVMTALESVVQMFGDETKKNSYEVVLSHEGVKAQLSHERAVQNPGLIPLFMAIHNVRVEQLPNFFYTLVSVEENGSAKNLASQALDG